jgi:hypothetical protein
MEAFGGAAWCRFGNVEFREGRRCQGGSDALREREQDRQLESLLAKTFPNTRSSLLEAIR